MNRCPSCGSLGAYTSLSSAECLHPWCEKFSVDLASEPFTLGRRTPLYNDYLSLMKNLASTPERDTATKKKVSGRMRKLLDSREIGPGHG